MTEIRALKPDNKTKDHKSRKLILGCAMTGAKYTPQNHHLRKDRIFDAICCGDMIPCTDDEIVGEAVALYEAGCRYIHVHARNGTTREQTADLGSYSSYGRRLLSRCPDVALSYGGSRNGVEIDRAVEKFGEFSRVAHSELPLSAGGAHFVTGQAAVELQVTLDMERQGYLSMDCETGDFSILKPIDNYLATTAVSEVKLDVFATKGARNYGASSAAMQFEVLKKTTAARANLKLPFECEWTQLARSYALTHMIVHEFDFGFSKIEHLNITILFGFSPRLPFPDTYDSFCQAVQKAKSIARPGQLEVSVTCGASVLPQQALKYCRAMDVGPQKGEVMGPTDIIAGYCAMPVSGVDVVRVGLEDTPYIVSRDLKVLPTTNFELVQRTKDTLSKNGVAIDLVPEAILGVADQYDGLITSVGLEKVHAA